MRIKYNNFIAIAEKHIRKVVTEMLFVVFCVSLSACNNDRYGDLRPTHFENSKWICEEYQVWFVVLGGTPYGKGMIDGKEEEISFISDYGTGVQIHLAEEIRERGYFSSETMIWKGLAKYSAEQMTLYEASFSTGIFGESENEAVFIREDLTEEEALSLLEKEGIQLEESSLGGDKTETE